jgi:uncharacterized Ntn-hydrolase superfamily protein
MVIAYFLVETRICKKDDYETKLLEALETGRQRQGGRRREVQAAAGRGRPGLLERPPSDG